ncbi:MAG: 3-oxoacyl-[acyl-carrier-protein] synthase III C-terminal domain-containing protein [Pseudomonadota bacterium]
MGDYGISAFGAYIPRLRLQRSAIIDANAWANSALAAHGKGERSMCNWDEDSVTMAVEAARDALGQIDRTSVDAVHLASTTLPFADRQNAGIVAEALNLREDLATLDVTSSLRAGTTGLLNALNTVAAGVSGSVLYMASEHRRSQTGTPQELLYGDGSAALVLGRENVVAKFVAGHTRSVDFVDHYRGQTAEYDYDWEERWIRDEGYLKIVPAAINAALEKADLSGSDIHYFALPCVLRRVPQMIAKATGISDDAITDTLQAVCGDTGAAHSLILLVNILEQAKPGEKVLVAGFGQGCDVAIFEVTEAIASLTKRRGVSGSLARRAAETNYDRFLTFNNLVNKGFGKRAEADKQTALSTLYRNRKMLTGFVGGRCEECGTVQFPKSHYCVNPNCGAAATQEDYAMADVPGTVVTWTADSLTFAIDPPAYFGMVQFETGGRLMVDFTDVDKETFDIGGRVTMNFRVREIDEERGFRKYFWKVVQAGQAA